MQTAKSLMTESMLLNSYLTDVLPSARDYGWTLESFKN